MSALAYLGIAVGLSVFGLTLLALLRRRPRSMQAGMEAFSRELQALAPQDTRAVRHEAHIENVQPTGGNSRHPVDRSASEHPAESPPLSVSADRNDRSARAARSAERSVKPET